MNNYKNQLKDPIIKDKKELMRLTNPSPINYIFDIDDNALQNLIGEKYKFLDRYDKEREFTIAQIKLIQSGNEEKLMVGLVDIEESKKNSEGRKRLFNMLDTIKKSKMYYVNNDNFIFLEFEPHYDVSSFFRPSIPMHFKTPRFKDIVNSNEMGGLYFKILKSLTKLQPDLLNKLMPVIKKWYYNQFLVDTITPEEKQDFNKDFLEYASLEIEDEKV